MRLLFDANLSPRLARLLEPFFPGSAHVFDCGAIHQSDPLIWDYARDHGLTIVSKDRDFHQMSLLVGAPPKVVWLRVGNASTDAIFRVIMESRDWISRFHDDQNATFLVL